MSRLKLTFWGISLALILAACGLFSGEEATLTPTPLPTTLVPTSTATLIPTDTATPTTAPTEITTTAEVTPEATPIPMVVQASDEDAIDPPIAILLPDGWEHVNLIQLYTELGGDLALVPATVYTGPVTGGTGYIVLLWAFENVVALGTNQFDLFGDGARLLRAVIIEQGCLTGTDVERGFTVGGLPATGTFFSVIGCEKTVDTRGWFAVLRQDNVNFAFYVYTAPLEAMNGIAMAELEGILDTVTFHVPEMILTREALQTATQEALLTATPGTGN